MRYPTVGFVLLAMGFFPVAAHAQKQVRPDTVSVKDLTVNGIPYQADTAKVRGRLGSPDSIQVDPDADARGLHKSGWWYGQLAVSVDEDGHVFGFLWRGGDYSTARGMRLGASKADVRAKYGNPEDLGDEDLLFYPRSSGDKAKGYVLFAVEDGKVVFIAVGSVPFDID
jgi:hypothetical protein